MLARRGFELDAAEGARVDTYRDVALIEHRIDEAIVAPSAADALGLPRRA